MCVCMLSHFSRVWLFVTLCQAPLSLGFSRQEYRSGLPCPSSRDLPDPMTESASPALARGFFITEPPGKPKPALLSRWEASAPVMLHHFSKFPQSVTKSRVWYQKWCCFSQAQSPNPKWGNEAKPAQSHIPRESQVEERQGKISAAGEPNWKEGRVKRRERWLAGRNWTTSQESRLPPASTLADTAQNPAQVPVLTAGSDWLFKGTVIRWWSSSALVTSAGSVESFALSTHEEKSNKKKKNGNNNHTKCCIHPANPGHGSHTAGTAPSSAKNW